MANDPKNKSKYKLAFCVYTRNITLVKKSANEAFNRNNEFFTHPAFLTAPVQLNEAAAVPVAFALYGDAMTLSPSSSSETAVVKLIRSSSEIFKKQKRLELLYINSTKSVYKIKYKVK